MAVYQAQEMPAPLTATKPQRVAVAVALADVPTVRSMPAKAAQEVIWERHPVRQSGVSQPGQATRLDVLSVIRGRLIRVTQHAGDRPHLSSDAYRRLTGKEATDSMWKLRGNRSGGERH